MIKVSIIIPKSLQSMSTTMRKALHVEVGRIAKNAQDFIRREIAKPKTGRIYRKRGRTHVASAPGEFPANDTGMLRSKIEFRQSGAMATIGALTGPHYAKYLEGGTRRMERRPFIEPTKTRYARLGPPRLFRAIMRALGRP